VGRIAVGNFNDSKKPVELALTMSCEDGELGIPTRFCVDWELTIKKRFTPDGDMTALDHLARVMRNTDFEGLRGYRTGRQPGLN